MNIINILSPHHTSGRKRYRPEAIVIHIMEGSLSGTDDWFRDPRSKVSAHYGIGRNGDIHQYVLEMNTAWHAGRVNAPTWSLIKSAGNGLYVNPNYYTIGIEHEGREDSDWTEEMYKASGDLIRDICTRWSIPVDRNHIIGHHEIYALKTCPGTKVNLNKLIRLAGGALDVPPVTEPGQSPKIAEKGKVTTKTKINIRPQPTTKLKAVNTIERNVQLAYDGYTDKGEKIGDNAKWFYTDEGNWFWSGAVTTIKEVPVNNIAGEQTGDLSATLGNTGLTIEQIRRGSGAKTANATRFSSFVADTCSRYEIDTPVRRLCFLAQVGHESGGLYYTEELASGRAYEGRADLGNTHPGDGMRYKGRGLIQITGRFNYKELSEALGVDLVSNPKLLGGRNVNECTNEQLKYAALSAGWFWNKKGLNAIADQVDIHQPIDRGNNLKLFKRITRLINGGYNGLADRINKYQAGVPFFYT